MRCRQQPPYFAAGRLPADTTLWLHVRVPCQRLCLSLVVRRHYAPAMPAKKCRWLFVGLAVVIVIGWAMGQFDYARLVAGKRPTFARVQLHLADGGSGQYLGLGYTVTDRHEMRW